MKNGDVLVVRYLRHGEKPKRGERVTPLTHTHHGTYRPALAVRAVKRPSAQPRRT